MAESQPSTLGPRRVRDDCDAVTALWWCPVCGAAVHRRARPGRPRVYCANACRQRAYRCRRDLAADRSPRPTPTAPHHPPPAVWRRATTRARSHAVRQPDVLVGDRCDTSGRAVTLCGAFARPARPRPGGHIRFVPDLPWSCHTCARLSDHEPTPP